MNRLLIHLFIYFTVWTDLLGTRIKWPEDILRMDELRELEPFQMQLEMIEINCIADIGDCS